jgi:uncharacterized protein (TIGR03083 family)
VSVFIAECQWSTARNSFKEVGDRFAHLLTAVRDPSAMATADWSVADVAAHVAVLARLDTALVGVGEAERSFPGVEERLRVITVDTVHRLNQAMMAQFPERDVEVLARSLRSDIDQILRASKALGPARTVDWLGGAKVPVAGLLSHLVNEMLIHGRDIARATGQRWAIPPEDAALFFEVFMIGTTRCGLGRLLDGARAPERRIAVEFRSRYTAPVMLVVQNGTVTAEEPGTDIDVHLWFDPPSLNLMLFGRMSRARALATGKVAVWGPRPWLLPAFLRVVRTP